MTGMVLSDKARSVLSVFYCGLLAGSRMADVVSGHEASCFSPEIRSLVQVCASWSENDEDVNGNTIIAELSRAVQQTLDNSGKKGLDSVLYEVIAEDTMIGKINHLANHAARNKGFTADIESMQELRKLLDMYFKK